MDEKRLIARVLAGDPAAERALYEAHVNQVYRLAYRMAGDAELAEDFTQETFLRAFDRLAGFRGEAALSTWLHSITVSVAVSGLRKLGRRRQHEVQFTSEAPVPVRPAGAELRRHLFAAIDGLPEQLRTAFVMHCAEGYKHREIAAVLGIPVNTSKARLFRARQKLREALGLLPESHTERVEI